MIPRRVVVVLILGIVHASAWLCVAFAQTDLYRRVGKVEEKQEGTANDLAATRLDLAGLNTKIEMQGVTMSNLALKMTDMATSVEQSRQLMIGVFITVIGGLASLLWSMRQWKPPAPRDKAPTIFFPRE